MFRDRILAYLQSRTSFRQRCSLLLAGIIGVIVVSSGSVSCNTVPVLLDGASDVAVDGDAAHRTHDAHSDGAIYPGCDACGGTRPCVCTVAGAAGTGYQNGANAIARFYRPTDVAVDGDMIVVADQMNDTVRAIANGATSTLAGPSHAGEPGHVDGPADLARFSWPSGVAVIAPGELVIADGMPAWIRGIKDGMVTTLAGGGGVFVLLGGVARSESGGILVADAQGHAVRRVEQNAVTTVVKGNAPCMAVLPGSIGLRWPLAVAAWTNGSILVADQECHCVWLIDANGTVGVLAGKPGISGGADGSNAAARFNGPSGLAVDDNGDVFVTEWVGARVRRISGGSTTTVAGDGTRGFRDGPAASAQFDAPSGVALDARRDLIVADRNNDRIRVVLLH